MFISIVDLHIFRQPRQNLISPVLPHLVMTETLRHRFDGFSQSLSVSLSLHLMERRHVGPHCKYDRAAAWQLGKRLMLYTQVALIKRRIFLFTRERAIHTRIVIIAVSAEQIGPVDLQRPLFCCQLGIP